MTVKTFIRIYQTAVILILQKETSMLFIYILVDDCESIAVFMF